MRLTWHPIDLPLSKPFKIAGQAATEVRHNVIVSLESGELVGMGEAEPTGYYGESAQTAIGALDDFDVSALDGFERGESVEKITAACAEQLVPKHMSVLSAIDCALWDLAGKRANQPVWGLLGMPPACTVPTSFTLGMAAPDEMARDAAVAARKYKILKIKVGSENDIAVLEAIRRVTDIPLRVDANSAWNADEAIERIHAIAVFNVELVEQPCARHDIDGLRRVRDKSPVPIIADESCHTARDVDTLAGAVDGVNIKLVKSGGLSEAVRIIRRANDLGLRLMVGCMTSSSLAITAASHIYGAMEFVDLDGNLLLADDPYAGATLRDGAIDIPSEPGLGVTAR